MKLLTVKRPDGTHRVSAWSESLGVIGLEDLATRLNVPESRFQTARQVLEKWPRSFDSIRSLLARAEAAGVVGTDLADTEIGPPIPDPEKVLCVGLNYVDHIEEGGFDRPKSPEGFFKLPSTLTGPRGPVRYPREVATKLDYELELAVVVGGPGSDPFSPRRPQRLVAGYSIFIDFTARDLLGSRGAGHLMIGKNLPSFGSFGPFLVSADEIADPQRLALTLKVNNVVRQQSCTSNMIFGVEEILDSFARLGLRAGDVIATGTPAGVGAYFRNEAGADGLLKEGDVVAGTIEGLGSQLVTIV